MDAIQQILRRMNGESHNQGMEPRVFESYVREVGVGYNVSLGLFLDRTDEWVEGGHLGNSG